MLTRLTRTAAGTKTLVMEEGVATGFKVLKVTAIWRNFRTPQQIECKETETDYMWRDQWRYWHLLRLTLLCNTFLMQVKIMSHTYDATMLPTIINQFYSATCLTKKIHAEVIKECTVMRDV